MLWEKPNRTRNPKSRTLNPKPCIPTGTLESDYRLRSSTYGRYYGHCHDHDGCWLITSMVEILATTMVTMVLPLWHGYGSVLATRSPSAVDVFHAKAPHTELPSSTSAVAIRKGRGRIPARLVRVQTRQELRRRDSALDGYLTAWRLHLS